MRKFTEPSHSERVKQIKECMRENWKFDDIDFFDCDGWGEIQDSARKLIFLVLHGKEEDYPKSWIAEIISQACLHCSVMPFDEYGYTIKNWYDFHTEHSELIKDWNEKQNINEVSKK